MNIKKTSQLLWTLPLLWMVSCGQSGQQQDQQVAASTAEEKINPGGYLAAPDNSSDPVAVEFAALEAGDLYSAYDLACDGKSDAGRVPAGGRIEPITQQLKHWGELAHAGLKKECTKENKDRVIKRLTEHQQRLEQYLADLKSGAALTHLQERLAKLKDGTRLKELQDRLDKLEDELAAATDEKDKKQLSRRIEFLEKVIADYPANFDKRIKHLEEIIADYQAWSQERIKKLQEEVLVEIKAKIEACSKV